MLPREHPRYWHARALLALSASFDSEEERMLIKRRKDTTFDGVLCTIEMPSGNRIGAKYKNEKLALNQAISLALHAQWSRLGTEHTNDRQVWRVLDSLDDSEIARVVLDGDNAVTVHLR